MHKTIIKYVLFIVFVLQKTISINLYSVPVTYNSLKQELNPGINILKDSSIQTKTVVDAESTKGTKTANAVSVFEELEKVKIEVFDGKKQNNAKIKNEIDNALQKDIDKNAVDRNNQDDNNRLAKITEKVITLAINSDLIGIPIGDHIAAYKKIVYDWGINRSQFKNLLLNQFGDIFSMLPIIQQAFQLPQPSILELGKKLALMGFINATQGKLILPSNMDPSLMQEGKEVIDDLRSNDPNVRGPARFMAGLYIVGAISDITAIANLGAITKFGKPSYSELRQKVKLRMYRDTTHAYEILNKLREHDPLSWEHSLAVSRLSERFAKFLGYGPIRTWRLKMEALLHDMGKLKMTRRQLEKGPNEKFTPEEVALKLKHPEEGVKILKENGLGRYSSGAGGHHWRPDGTGYSFGPITQNAQIIAILDSFDSMTAKRFYNVPKAATKALNEIDKFKGKQFSEKYANLFSQGMGQWLKKMGKKADSSYYSLRNFFGGKGESYITIYKRITFRSKFTAQFPTSKPKKEGIKRIPQSRLNRQPRIRQSKKVTDEEQEKLEMESKKLEEENRILEEEETAMAEELLQRAKALRQEKKSFPDYYFLEAYEKGKKVMEQGYYTIHDEFGLRPVEVILPHWDKIYPKSIKNLIPYTEKEYLRKIELYDGLFIKKDN